MTVARLISLIELPREAHQAMLQFVPDTPWTTTTVHALRRKCAVVYVDSPDHPRNVVVVVKGGDAPGDLDQAYLFGLPTSEGLRSFVSGVQRATEFICDDDLSPIVREFHPLALQREAVVHWFARLESPAAVEPVAPVRRLRLADADALGRLLPAWAFRTFATPKEMLMGGAVFGIEQDGGLASAACVVDQSMKHERILVETAEIHRRKGFGAAVGRRLVRHVLDGGRLPCGFASRQSAAALKLAHSVGFPEKALLATLATGLPSAPATT